MGDTHPAPGASRVAPKHMVEQPAVDTRVACYWITRMAGFSHQASCTGNREIAIMLTRLLLARTIRVKKKRNEITVPKWLRVGG
jgi:hypothetical protein